MGANYTYGKYNKIYHVCSEMPNRAFEFYFMKSEYSSQLHDWDIYIIDFMLW